MRILLKSLRLAFSGMEKQHDQELRDLRTTYQKELDDTRAKYQEQIDNLTQQLALV